MLCGNPSGPSILPRLGSKVARCWSNSEIDHVRPKLGRTRSRLGQLRSKSGRCRAKSAQIWPTSAVKFEGHRPDFERNRSKSGRIGSTACRAPIWSVSIEFRAKPGDAGRTWSEIGQHRPNLPKSEQPWSIFCPKSLNLGQILLNQVEFGSTWARVGLCWPKSDAEIGPSFVNIGAPTRPLDPLSHFGPFQVEPAPLPRKHRQRHIPHEACDRHDRPRGSPAHIAQEQRGRISHDAAACGGALHRRGRPAPATTGEFLDKLLHVGGHALGRGNRPGKLCRRSI